MSDSAWDFGISVADIADTMDEYYRLRPDKAQFTRFADTAKWFDPRGELLKGNIHHFKAWTAPATGTRRMTVGTAETSELPRAREPEWKDIGVPYSDLIAFEYYVRISDLAEEKTSDTKHAISNIALRMVSEAELDHAEAVNAAIYQDQDSVIAKVVQKYDADGSSYSGGATTTAYLSIDSGSIARFKRNMKIDFRVQSSSAIRVTANVDSVNYQDDGPVWTGTRVADIGPGIICSYDSAEGTGNDTDFDSVVDNDEIVLSSEGLLSNFHGFPDWFGEHTNVYKEADGSTAYDRDAAANHWSIPEVLDFTEAGSAQDIDLDVHLRGLADILPYRVKSGRQARQNENVELQVKQSMVAFGSPRLINDAVDAGRDQHQFWTTGNTTMDAAKSQELWGNVGFNGVVYNSPTLGNIALQPDPMAEPHTLTITDPNSFFFLHRGGLNKPRWLMNAGSRFSRLRGGHNRLTLQQDAGAISLCLLQCDQPAVNVRIKGIKSSLE